MHNFYLAFVFGLGMGAFVYTKLGRRIGYGNSQGVWKLVIASFIFTTFIVFSFLTWVVH